MALALFKIDFTALTKFRERRSGQVAVIFALSATVLTLMTGGSLDLLRAYQLRQKLSETATLACQYASRPSVVKMASPNYPGANGGTLYTAAVTTFIATALSQQKAGFPQTNGTPFTFTASGPADVRLTATLPTTFLKMASIPQIAIGASKHCYDSPATINQDVPQSGTNTYYVAQEGFEAAGTPSVQWYADFSWYGFTSTPHSFNGSSPTYTGSSGTVWYGTGYCLETDRTGVINSTSPEGSHTAELDCDNGSGSAGNSSISTRLYLGVGNFELRYFFRSRVFYPNYYPAYLCASTAGALSWANDINSFGSPVANALRTNQIEVYLDRDTTGKPPVHTTIDGAQQLAGSNLIDLCVDSYNWVERSVRITVTTPAYYWLSFAANGQNDSYGGQIDNVRLCVGTCPGIPQDNFPSTWLAANNGFVPKVLFEDTFESPAYAEDNYSNHGIAKSGNLNLSTGTSGTVSSGWPYQSSSGWATAPFNQVNYGTLHNGASGAYQGSQYVLLDGFNSNGDTRRNRLISRPFLLVPGYYQVSYDYISIVDFSNIGIYGIFCASNPASGSISTSYTPKTGIIRYYNAFTTDGSTNIVDVFMSHGSLISTPIGGGAASSQTSYTNPNGTTSTTPTVQPDAVSWSYYDATTVNPLLDTCAYASGYQWVPRTATVKIGKPGLYWLTFSANGGTADGNGGGIDDVKLTALGSPYMISPPYPSVTTTIPVPNPQPSGRTYFDGFYIVNDPFTFPAPQQ